LILQLPVIASGTMMAANAGAFDWQGITYSEARAELAMLQPDAVGVWTCGYKTSPTSQEVVMFEIDEQFLYLKQRNHIWQLTQKSAGENSMVYTLPDGSLVVRMEILQRTNFSEYQESHDRQVTVEIENQGRSEKRDLYGEDCGI
jgi:hypothetical protein